MGKEPSIASPSTRIVHSYSPRAHFVRRLVASAAIVVALTFATIGALIAARSLWPEPAPDAPRPSRVVNVDVRP